MTRQSCLNIFDNNRIGIIANLVMQSVLLTDQNFILLRGLLFDLKITEIKAHYDYLHIKIMSF